MNQSPNSPADGGASPSGGPRRTRRGGTRAATRRMVTCAILSALAVVVLGVGTVLEIIDLSCAALAAIIILLVFVCYGTRYALLSYAVTSVLGVLLMPQSLAVWTFLGLMGYYPIIKRKLDRLPRLLSWLLKLVLFAVVMAACLSVFHFLFYAGEGSMMDSLLKIFGEESGKSIMVWAILGLSLVTFIIFDLLLDRLIILYNLRFKRMLDKWMKP